MSELADDSATGAVRAAVAVAGRLGLPADDVVVLRDLGTTLVHLRPSAVVARAWRTGRRDPATVSGELTMTAYLASHGAPVAAPYDDPGPHETDGWTVTLWAYVDHDPARSPDARAAGRGLAAIHDLLSSPQAPALPDLPDFMRLAEATRIIAGLDVSEADRAGLGELLDRATVARDALRHLPVQPLHGDAWLGNVLRTSHGPVWTDFELVCRGPREADLAANLAVARHRGRRPGDDELLEGYGEVDHGLVATVLPVALVPFTAWSFRLATDQAEHLPAARARLALALEDLRRQQEG